MIDHTQMTAAVHAYVAAFENGNAEAAAAIFAEDAIIEDPIGTEPHAGQIAIREFYARSMRTGAKLTLTGPLHLAVPHLAFSMQVRLNWQGADLVIDVIETLEFDVNGKVRRMKAYFGPSNIADISRRSMKDA
jgi:steroid delta-isomerase